MFIDGLLHDGIVSDSNSKKREHVHPYYRGAMRPGFARDRRPPKQQEGAGKAGCALHPRSRVQMHIEKNAHEHTGSAEAVRPSLRNGFTAYFALSSVTGLVDTVIDVSFPPT